MPNSKLAPSAPTFTDHYVCRCRLEEIAKERGLVHATGAVNYTAISNRTGIFVTVIRKLAQQKTKGIDFDTILRLCLGLSVTPSQLFEIDDRNDENAPTPPA